MPKRFYRSRKNRIIAGVCGGLGEYFNIDPIIFRVIFFVLHGVNLIYFLLWIFVPENPTQPVPKSSSIGKKILLAVLFIFVGFFIIEFAKNFFLGNS